MSRTVSLHAFVRAFTVVAILVADVSTMRADTYIVDRIHSEAAFKIRHLVGRFIGKFDDFTCIIVGDPSKPAESSVQFTIKAASIDTGDAKRDDHLRSVDFFDIEKFPEITFKSTSIKAADKKNVYEVTGDLTMRGVTKRITLPVEYFGTIKNAQGREIAGFTLDTTLNRKDYGINWNEELDRGGFVLGDDVEVTINLETKKSVAPASDPSKRSEHPTGVQ